MNEGERSSCNGQLVVPVLPTRRTFDEMSDTIGTSLALCISTSVIRPPTGSVWHTVCRLSRAMCRSASFIGGSTNTCRASRVSMVFSGVFRRKTRLAMPSNRSSSTRHSLILSGNIFLASGNISNHSPSDNLGRDVRQLLSSSEINSYSRSSV